MGKLQDSAGTIMAIRNNFAIKLGHIIQKEFKDIIILKSTGIEVDKYGEINILVEAFYKSAEDSDKSYFYITKNGKDEIFLNETDGNYIEKNIILFTAKVIKEIETILESN